MNWLFDALRFVALFTMTGLFFGMGLWVGFTIMKTIEGSIKRRMLKRKMKTFENDLGAALKKAFMEMADEIDKLDEDPLPEVDPDLIHGSL